VVKKKGSVEDIGGAKKKDKIVGKTGGIKISGGEDRTILEFRGVRTRGTGD